MFNFKDVQNKDGGEQIVGDFIGLCQNLPHTQSLKVRIE